MISVLSICKVIRRKICTGKGQLLASIKSRHMRYPDKISSSSNPYNFMCCRPHPSFIRAGVKCFLKPVKFGVWNIRTSTLLGPNSATKEASNDAQDGFGVSLVPRRASVRKDTFKSALLFKASRIVAICDV